MKVYTHMGKHDRVRPPPKLCIYPGRRVCVRWTEGGRRRIRYFGKYGSSEANVAYAQFCEEWLRNGGPPAPVQVVRRTPENGRKIVSAEVVGFLVCGTDVLLSRADKTSWVRGHLGGVTGRMDDRESPFAAIVREFEDETRVKTAEREWSLRVVVHGPVHDTYYLIAHRPVPPVLKAARDRACEWCRVTELHNLHVEPSLLWLLPLCLTDELTNPIELTSRQ